MKLRDGGEMMPPPPDLVRALGCERRRGTTCVWGALREEPPWVTAPGRGSCAG